MKDKSKKQAITLSIVAVITLIALVVGATYAYFSAQGGSATSTNLNVTTYTTDVFTFAAGDEINLEITQSNFASGKGNAVGNTFASATLTANNKTNTATEHYYLYLNIENNDFEYTVNSATPELMLTVTDNEGNEITDIAGLTHATVTDAKGTTVSGYDITTKNGLLTLFNNREITTTSKKEEKWNIIITFVNLDADQTKNANKSLSAKVMIQKEEIVQTAISKTCKNGQNLSECIIATNNTDDKLYHHDGTLANGISDGSYRYAGASESVNNYICLGSTESPCPETNLFRIIGVFEDQAKVIRTKRIERMAWDSNESNTWSTSSLNAYLNGEYLTSLGTLSEKIAATTWKVGGNTAANIIFQTPSVAYQNEIVNPEPGSKSTTGETRYTAKIGLMYVSDYGFAADPSAWTTTLVNYAERVNGTKIKSLNWLYLGDYEWTITRIADDSFNNALIEDYEGGVYDNAVKTALDVCPTFSLESSVTYSGGSGTYDSPIRIN